MKNPQHMEDEMPDESASEGCADQNPFTEQEWRIIHNALAIHQCNYRQVEDRQRIQQLMDKVRDNYIAPTT